MKIDRQVRKALEASGLPWELIPGHGHNKLRVAGKLIGVMGVRPNESSQRNTKNTLAQIKRITRENQNVSN